MKRIYIAIISVIFAFTLTGCNYFGVKISNEISNSALDEKFSFEENLEGFERVELDIDIEVSDINITKSDNSKFSLEQKANHAELLVIPSVDKNGNSITIKLRSKKTNLNNKNSRIVISLPVDLVYTINSRVAVGEQRLIADDLKWEEINVTSNVGDISFEISENQDELSNVRLKSDVGAIKLVIKNGAKSLEKIMLSSNVGDLNLTLSGDYSNLDNVATKSGVGKISSSMDGSFDEALSLESSSDVGDIVLRLNGEYKESSKAKIKSGTGKVDLTVNKNQCYELSATENEFVSKIKANNIALNQIKKGLYRINGDSSSKINMRVEVENGVGDLVIGN